MIDAELLARDEGDHRLPLLVWRFTGELTVASTASAGGGLGPRRWVVNAHVRKDYARHDLDVHAAEIAAGLGLGGAGVLMLTAADVRRVEHAECDGVTVDATVGITDPTWAADPDAAPLAAAAGTINIVGQLPARLAESALLNALCTATEAKAQALAAAGIPGTGTPSDAITLTCPANGPAEGFGGPRSHWGVPLAHAVYGSVLAGARAWTAAHPR